MRRIFFIIFSLLLGVGLFILVLKIVGLSKIEQSLATLSVGKLSIIILISFLAASVSAWKWREILKGMGTKISYKNALLPYFAGYAIMLLAPAVVWGSELLRVYLIREKDSIKWERGMASVIVDRVLEWTVSLIVIVFGVSIFLMKVYKVPLQLEFSLGVVFLFFFILVFYFYVKVFRKESFLKVFSGIWGIKKIAKNRALLEIENEIFNFFHIKNRKMWTVIVATLIKNLALWARTWILILFLGGKIDGASSLSVLGFNNLAVLVPIPAAIGSSEAVQTFIFGSLGLVRSSATAFALTIRLAEIAVSLVGIIVFFRFGIYFIKKLLFRNPGKLASEILGEDGIQK